MFPRSAHLLTSYLDDREIEHHALDHPLPISIMKQDNGVLNEKSTETSNAGSSSIVSSSPKSLYSNRLRSGASNFLPEEETNLTPARQNAIYHPGPGTRRLATETNAHGFGTDEHNANFMGVDSATSRGELWESRPDSWGQRRSTSVTGVSRSQQLASTFRNKYY